MQNTKNYKTMGICAAIFFVNMPNMYAECMHSNIVCTLKVFLSFVLFLYSPSGTVFSAVNRHVKLETGYVSIWMQFAEKL